MSSTLKKLQALEEQKISLQEELKQEQSRLKFKCGCGKMHSIKDCDAIQTHWYTPPHGCYGGDYWNRGELQVICPVTDKKNRFLFTPHRDYSKREHYKHSAEMQFIRMYSPLFKSVIDDYDKDRRSWWNNEYVDQNRKKFMLNVED